MVQISRTDPQDPSTAADPVRAARLLAYIVDESDMRVAAVDADYRITAVSRAYCEDFERRFGVALEVGTDLREALAAWPEERDRVISHWARALAGEEHSVVVPVGGPGPRRAYDESRFRPLWAADGRVEGAWQIVRDVTDHVTSARELRRERELIERIVDAIPMMIVIYDPISRAYRVNREFGRLLGWTSEELADRDLLEACFPDPAAREEVRRFMKSSGGAWRDFALATRDGARLETSWAGIRLSDGTRVGIGIDIRERRRTERALRFLADASAALAGSLDYEETLRRVAELAVPEIADGCAVDLVDEDGTIRRVAMAHRDPELRRLLDAHVRYSPRRLDSPTGVGAVARTGRSLLHQGIPEWAWQRAADDPARLELLRALGLRSVLIVPLELGDARFGAITLIQGESGRRFTEADVPLAEELARRAAGAIQNARAYRAERRARTAAERASEAKDQFLAIMSHELRTPLTAVLGYADLLASEVSGALNERQREHINRIQQSALHLITIIDEILIFARTEAGKEEVRVATVDAAAIARDVAALLEPEANAKGIVLRTAKLDAPFPLDTDGGKLRQVLANLVGNAVKFTDHGEVVLELDASAADRVEFRVRDSGPGIPEDQHERIFEPFTQLDGSSTREKGGTGLGLTVCRRLTALLGGAVTVDSRPGAGSTFTVILPRRYTAPAGPAAGRAGGQGCASAGPAPEGVGRAR
ncbi:MAG TPA: ATP-binding protein [Longimicrobiales bacterium]